jgi:dTDP-L-rhamnose 4-epimerase
VRVLVTGGAGFVGSHVVDRFVKGGHDVLVLDALLPAAHGDALQVPRSDATFVRGDLRDPDIVATAARGVDAVCHQASMVGLGVDFGDVVDYVSHNDLGTAQLLQTLHETSFRGRLILASSMVVYGEGRYECARHGSIRAGPRSAVDLRGGRFEPRCPTCGKDLAWATVAEDTPSDPRNVYAATKLHQEHLCAVFAREHLIPLVILRYHNVYGPRMPRDTPYAGVASVFRSALQRGEAPTVFEDGGQLRDFVHVTDVARANELALESGVDGPFNVASGDPRTIGEMAQALVDAFGPGAPRPRIMGGYRLGDVRHIVASPERATRELGFTARVGFRKGMQMFAAQPLREPAGIGGSE